MLISDQQALTLLKFAQQAARQAYAPYSHFQVGAAALTLSGEIYSGCNVENASYGLTVCAERVALMKAISDGHQQFSALALWAKKQTETECTPVMPCGACRQVMAEFFSAETVLLCQAETGSLQALTITDLLPAAFELKPKI